MANVWKGTDGRWRIDYNEPSGVRRRFRLPAGASKEEAKALLAAKQREVTQAKIMGAESVQALKPITFRDFVKDEFLPACEVRLTGSTYKGYVSLSRAVDAALGSLPLRAITTAELERFMEKQARREIGEEMKRLRPATVNRMVMFVSSALTSAAKKGYITSNPARNVAKLREDNAKPRHFTDEEEGRIMSFLPGWMRPIVTFALHTGMRRGEILQLTWADVSLEEGNIRVSKAKNHKPRHVRMNAVVRGLMERLKPAAEAWERSPYVFPNPDGKPWNGASVSHAFDRALTKAGVESANFHVCRHTFASRLAQAGVPLNTIRELLGHTSPGVVLRYAHLAPSNLQSAVDILARPKKSPKVGTRLAQRAGAKRVSAVNY